MKNPTRFNVYEASINADYDVDGGDPQDVMEALITRGYGCVNNSAFANLFPSQATNVISELEDAVALSGMPVFYSISPYTPEGEKRQKQIAELASKLASHEVNACGVYKGYETGLATFLTLQNQIDKIDIEVTKLEDEKDPFDGWFGTRTTEQINKDLKIWNSKRAAIKKQADSAHESYVSGSSILDYGKNDLEKYSIQDAAEIVYYWAQKSYSGLDLIFNKYGLGAYKPTMKQYILEKVQKDPVTAYQYSGGMYPYRLIRRIMDNACKDNRLPIPKNIKAMKLALTSSSQGALKNKLESLLNSSQGVGVTINSKILQDFTQGAPHAVNIIGCRKVNGKKEYLIHNSWGSDCNNYSQALKVKCSNGRPWVSENLLFGNLTEIQWIEKK
jgi:hypothetical protein